MSNFAIFNSIGKGKNQGGPKGYIYNLLLGCEKIGTRVEFICESKNTNNSDKNNRKEHKYCISFIYDLRVIAYFFKRGIRLKKNIKLKNREYKMLHVHCSEDVYYLRKFIKYKGKIIFTPHRPEELENEYINNINKNIKGKHFIVKLLARYIEKESYKMCDAFIFPSKGAMEIYYNFPGFKKYGKNKIIKYVYTGVEKNEIKICKKRYRADLNIENNDFVISYIGRHNKIKGYDLLTSISEDFIKNKIFCICAGNKDGVENIPNNKYWKELGYINNSEELMNASDVIVIPNRNTYFDLVIIEALSVGKIVITSNTGGNIDISEKTNGIILFDSSNEKDLLNKIIKVKALNIEEKKELENDNFKFYEKYCTLNAFAKNYIKIIDEFKKIYGIE